MALGFRSFKTGITLETVATLTGDLAGQIQLLTSDNKVYLRNASSASPIVTEAHPASLSNKTLVSPIISGSFVFSSLTANTVPYLDGSKALASSTVTPTELDYLSGVTSSIQTQFTNKANVTLNNLGTTAINAHLLVNTDISYDLGTAGSRFRRVYTQFVGNYAGDDNGQIDVQNAVMYDFLNTKSVDYGTHKLYQNTSTIAFEWSGSSNDNKTRKLVNVVDPTNPQDAATKNYVDTTSTVTLSAIGATPNANGATLTGQVLNLQPANASFGGVVTTGAQTFAGAKTFSSTIVGSISGNAATVTTNANLTGGVTSVGNAATVITNANLTGDITSSGNATTYASTVPLNKGGTGQTTKAPAFDALQPMTTIGDIIVGSTSGTGIRLANGTAGFILTAQAGAPPAWVANAGGGANTSLSNLTSVSINDSLVSSQSISSYLSAYGFALASPPINSGGSSTVAVSVISGTVTAPGTGGSGIVTIGSGDGRTASGALNLTTGTSAGNSVNGGAVTLASGGTGGTSSNSGTVSISTGAVTGTSSNSGPLNISSGTVAAGGTISGTITTSTGTGPATGNLVFNTGNSSTTTSGDITLQTGTAVGTRGSINLNANTIIFTTTGGTSIGTITSGTWNGTTIAIANGGTGVTSVTTTPTVSSFSAWDANANMSADSFIAGYTTTATAAGTTTLTVNDKQQQYFTGTTTQTIVLPVTSTMVLGQTFKITNNSTGLVTVQSSGANNIVVQPSGTTTIYTVILTSGTTAASWSTGGYTGDGGFIAPTVQKFTSGSGTYTTPTSPRKPLYLRIRGIGGGGGGGGSGTTAGGAAGNGGNTTFNSTTCVGNGGALGGTNGATGGAGGSASLSGAVGLAVSGGSGGGNGYMPTAVGAEAGGQGGNGIFGGGAGAVNYSGSGAAAAVNSGGGGGGAGGTGAVGNNSMGSGGGAGGGFDALLGNPTASYSYAVGAGGAAGTAGASGNDGTAGAAGYLEITEYYQ